MMNCLGPPFIVCSTVKPHSGRLEGGWVGWMVIKNNKSFMSNLSTLSLSTLSLSTLSLSTFSTLSTLSTLSSCRCPPRMLSIWPERLCKMVVKNRTNKRTNEWTNQRTNKAYLGVGVMTHFYNICPKNICAQSYEILR